ncbi:hypothetical protein GKZ89_14780 [Bacillus mangrovi]|uniref:Siderophore biosynthesis protein n=1 Tax=Metabacillus mangrovi TaxID=1491830 RepID=A0A7X2S8C7_9BACI|nr:IucA/IucC family protein [Metabacillus mangrovi]MTH54666.1 hypothetical protein [Metabacillus mangrovi]
MNQVNPLHIAKMGILNRLVQSLIREQLVPYRIVGDELFIDLQQKASIRVEIKQMFFLSRFENGRIELLQGGASETIEEASKLIGLLQTHGLFPVTEEADHFKAELQNSEENYAIGLSSFYRRQSEWSPEKNTLLWLEELAVEDDSFSPLAFLEQLAVHGHTLHPCTKTKRGMSKAEVRAYSPECGGRADIVYAAVHRSLTASSLLHGEKVKELLFRQNSRLESVFTNELQQRSLNPDDYECIPLHPWQAEHTVMDLYQNEYESGLILLLKGLREPALALASLRTLLPEGKGRNNPFHLKTAINVQATSAVRTVSPASAIHGPMFSKLFKELSSQKGFPKNLILLEEAAGIHFKDPESELREKNLAAMIRLNPELEISISSGEIAVPGTAFISDSPTGKGSFLLEAAALYKETMGIPTLEQAAKNWIGDYARVLFEALLPMMTRFGISLEAHLQNSIPVLKRGVPVRLMVRDFGGIKILNQRLQKSGKQFVFLKETHVEAENETALHDTAAHAIIQNHLGELIVQLVKELRINEAFLWETVYEEMEKVWSSLRDDPDMETDRKAMAGDELSLKSLVGMRLQYTIDNIYSKVPNPFAIVNKGGSMHAELQN